VKRCHAVLRYATLFGYPRLSYYYPPTPLFAHTPATRALHASEVYLLAITGHYQLNFHARLYHQLDLKGQKSCLEATGAP